MKRILVVIFSMVTGLTFGQGINFEDVPRWKDVLAKAKKEKKAIFVDSYTTWCGPCKQMDKDVFPVKEVGDFFNANFISFKLQMDKTPNDDAIKKGRYADAAMFEKTYQINSYPCYLFFDENGNLVHKAGGGGLKPADFIAIGKEALDPAQQMLSFKNRYIKGERSAEFILAYVRKLAAAGDAQLTAVADDFLSLQKDKFSLESIQLMMFMTTGSSSKYFMSLLKNKEKLATVIGKEKAANYLKKVIDAEVMSKAIKVEAGKDNQRNYKVDELGLLNYFNQFYSPDTAGFLTAYHAATILKMMDENQSYLKAKEVLATHRSKLDRQQAAQLALIVARKGAVKEDNELALSALSPYQQSDDHLVNLTLGKLYAYNGQQALALEYAAKALQMIRKSKPNYPDISAEEYLKRSLSTNPTPKIISN
ncbi:thioredoxin family protein [Pedobacter caeni]|uniref:Thioredoxin-like domain-containing protein n=1 Tax=Pedobacter caeni TaxID=288992 RepID=A0A1M5LH64_9SPHI|nr:thioredoxin fold domain-containing protein [Pedobacter caeni]SHG64377.1 Thioredoxin-like domain-containing protein [Pedobacter caeni]